MSFWERSYPVNPMPYTSLEFILPISGEIVDGLLLGLPNDMPYNFGMPFTMVHKNMVLFYESTGSGEENFRNNEI